MFYTSPKLMEKFFRSLVKIHKWCQDGYHTDRTVFVVTLATFISFGIIGIVTGYTPTLFISTISIGGIYLLIIIPLSLGYWQNIFRSFLPFNQTRK
jgi:hypothetical protein